MTDKPSRRRGTPIQLDLAKVRTRRFELGLTLKQVADRAGVTVSCLSLIENGHRFGRPSVLAALAKALECPLRELLPDQPAKAA